MSHSSKTNLQLFLNRLTSRSALSQEEQQAILDLPAYAQQVSAHRDFVLPGECVEHACLVVAGLVGRFDQNCEGKRQIIAMHILGDMCDLHSVVQPLPTSGLQALCVTTILRVPHSALRAVAARYPAVAQAFWRDCVVDAAILSEWVVNVGRRDAKTRVAHLMCELATRLKPDHTEDFFFDLPVNQSQLAEATSLTPVHINRTLQSLRADGLLEWTQRLIRVPQWTALAARGEFDPAYLQPLRPDRRLEIVQYG